MRLPREVRQQIVDHLQEQITEQACVKCRRSDFALEPSIYVMPELRPPVGEPPRSLRVLAVTCKGCGYLELFNANSLIELVEE